MELYDLLKNIIPNRIVMRLTVDGKPKYEATGIREGNFVDWDGTLRNKTFRAETLSMKILPITIIDAKELVLTFAENQYKGRNIKITPEI
jgi:hypothetical protein